MNSKESMIAALISLGKYEANTSGFETLLAKKLLEACPNCTVSEYRAQLLKDGVKPDPGGIALAHAVIRGMNLSGVIQTRYPVDVQNSWLDNAGLGSRYPVDVPMFQHGMQYKRKHDRELSGLGNEVWETTGNMPFGGGATNTYHGTPSTGSSGSSGSSGSDVNWGGLFNQILSAGVGLTAKYGASQIQQVNNNAQQSMNQMYTQQTGLPATQSNVSSWANQNPQYAAQAWQQSATAAGMSQADIQRILDASKSNTGLYVGLGVGGFLLIGGLIALVLAKRNDK